MKNLTQPLIKLVLCGLSLFALFEVNAQVTPLNDQARSLLNANVVANGVTYPYSFVVMGDSRDGSNTEIPLEFQQILDEINNETNFDLDDVRPSFIINCGDLVPSGDAGEYENNSSRGGYHDAASAFMTNSDIPLFSLPGNHEFYDNAGMGPANYATYVDANLDNYFDYGNSRFLLINNVFDGTDVQYEITSTQLATYESWIDQPPYRSSSFAFAHAPLHNTSTNVLLGDGYDDFANLLSSRSEVKGYFAGHAHYYKHPVAAAFGSVEHFITGAAGSEPDFLNTVNINDQQLNSFHYLLVTVTDCDEVTSELHVLGKTRTEDLYSSGSNAQDFDVVFPNGGTPADVTVTDNLETACTHDVVVHCETAGADAYTYIVYETDAVGNPLNSTVYTTSWYAGNLNQDIDFADLTYIGSAPNFSAGSYYGVKVGAGNCSGIWADDAAIVYINPASAYFYPTATNFQHEAFLHVGNYGGTVVGWDVSYTTPPASWVDAGLGAYDQVIAYNITTDRSFRARIQCGGFEYYSNYRTLHPYQAPGPTRRTPLSPDYSQTMKVYPNPTAGIFTIQLAELPSSEEAKVEVYNVLGELIISQQTMGQSSIDLSLSTQAKGIYLIKIAIGDQLLMERIIKE